MNLKSEQTLGLYGCLSAYGEEFASRQRIEQDRAKCRFQSDRHLRHIHTLSAKPASSPFAPPCCQQLLARPSSYADRQTQSLLWLKMWRLSETPHGKCLGKMNMSIAIKEECKPDAELMPASWNVNDTPEPLSFWPKSMTCRRELPWRNGNYKGMWGLYRFCTRCCSVPDTLLCWTLLCSSA